MKILVCGAGPLGSLLAAQLQRGGQAVSILARGRRLDDLRQHGIVVRDALSGAETTTRVAVVAELAPDDRFDLALVVMRKNQALEILPVLAANGTPNVLFLMNNAAGPGELVAALGRERVLIGFPGTAGMRDGHAVRCFLGTPEEPVPVPFGEIDGRIRARTHEVARALSSAPGFEAQIRDDMDTWQKYHVALLMPSLVPALYMTGTDRVRLARTRDAIVLAVRAGREGFRALRALGLPLTPARLRFFAWTPEPILVPMLGRLLVDEKIETALVQHARAAPDEMKHLTDEFLALIHETGVPTPTIDRLYPHFDPGAPLMPDGSAEIPLDWSPIWRGLGLVAGFSLALVLAARALRRGR